MPINSYLVHPQSNKKEELKDILNSMPECEVIPSENRDLLVLLTETETKEEEADLLERLNGIKEMKLMAMVSGFNTPIN